MSDNPGKRPSHPPSEPIRVPGKESTMRPLPRRIYQSAVAEGGGGAPFRILLDGRVARTPGKRVLALPTHPLALAVAAEWQAQGQHVDPGAMPLTRLANTVLDGVVGSEEKVAADIAAYGGSDLLCYRAAEPQALLARQAVSWDPVLAWAEAELGCRFRVTSGVMPVAQTPELLAHVAAKVQGFDAFRLAALHVMTTLTGSVILGLAVLRGELDSTTAWLAAHVEEDWQIEHWGEDTEARRRRALRRDEMEAAATLVRLLEA